MGLNLKSSITTHDAKGRSAKAVFYPDGFFVVQNDAQPKGQSRHFFFLEADNHTFTMERLQQKFLGHAAYHRAIKQGTSNPLQIPDFQVLHVSRTEKRAENVWTLARKLATKGVIPANLHWFGSEEGYLPDALFNAIWRTPADDQFRALRVIDR